MSGRIRSYIGNRPIPGSGLKIRNVVNRPVLLSAAGALIFAVDQGVKNRIEAEPAGSLPRDMEGSAGGYVRLDRYHNKGFALGRMKEDPEAVKLVSAAGCLSVAAALCTSFLKKGSLITQTGLSLTLWGALSNLADRISRGYVVDYMIIKKKPFSKLVINIGDAAIFAGTLITMFSMLARRERTDSGDG